MTDSVNLPIAKALQDILQQTIKQIDPISKVRINHFLIVHVPVGDDLALASP